MKHIFCDGTFMSCPPPFGQLYVLCSDIDSTTDTNNVVPLLFALMTNKKKDSYFTLFEMIKSQVPLFKPNKFTLDFEQATITAISEVFPCAEIKGCYYHFVKNIWKHGKEMKLLKTKRGKRIVALCASLPLTPESYLADGWIYICTEIARNDCPKLIQFQKYMKRFWFKSKFFTQMWAIAKERHRTNNCIEGFNRKLNKKLGKKYCNLVNFLCILKQEAKYNFLRIKENIVNKRKKSNIDNDNFILECQNQLISGEITVAHFLEQVK